MAPFRAKFSRSVQVVKNVSRDWGVFTLVQAIVCLAVYGSALWGARLLAPLDIAPAIFPAYKFVDPTSNGIPDNHYIIDQLIYDLPLQTVVYDAYQRGEIPWWDPYTYGGRPLLADAHINGTDPIRVLCYLTLPFELAYNWNLVIHSLVAAAGMFALLRFWSFNLFTCTALAIAWQFSGAFVMHFGHPWIAGTFVWFPFTWICWAKALVPGRSLVRNTAFAALFCGASFYSGNLQSHLYLPLLALGFLIGHFCTNPGVTIRAVFILSSSGIIGAALAAPVLANQVEFFLLSTREVTTSSAWWQNPVKVLLSLGSVFPWVTGTFRTLDIGKIVRSSGTAWLLFCGSATFVLAVIGIFGRRAISDSHRPLWKTTVSLVLMYLIIAGTPLVHIFYLRSAPLAVLGIVPLAAIGLHWLTSNTWIARPKIALATALSALVMVAALNASALLVYPTFRDQLTQAALTANSSNKAFPGGATALRKFQVDNFPFEVSLINPETVFSLISLLLISASMSAASAQNRRNLAYCAVIVSLLALITFAGRFIPDQPMEMLKRLKAGGPAQQQGVELVRGNNGRILDPDMQVFPYAMGALYKVHTVHGYSALQPAGIFQRPKEISLSDGYGADFSVHLLGSGALLVEMLSPHPPLGRFVSRDGPQISVAHETLNSLTLLFDKVAPATFYRTDTVYPGWASSPSAAAILAVQDIRTLIKIESPLPENKLQLLYRPTHWPAAMVVASCAVTFVVLLVLITILASLFESARAQLQLNPETNETPA